MSKRIYYIALCFCSLLSMAKEQNLKFDKRDFSYIQNGKEITIATSNNDFVSDIRENEEYVPDLPYYYVSLLFPTTGKQYNIEHSYDDYETIINRSVLISPTQCVFPASSVDMMPVEQQEPVYAKEKYPRSNVEIIAKAEIENHTEVVLKITPFIYKPEQGLFFINSVTIKSNNDFILVDKNDAIATINKECFANNQRPVNMRESLYTEQDSACYLIITCDSLKEHFINLARWKTIKGVKCKIVTVEDIYNMYSTGSNYLKIKNYLHDYYINSNNILKWVLLGGDDSIVPSVPCYVNVSTYDLDTVIIYEDNTAPADLYYSCFGGTFDWNLNNNDTIGEVGDGTNFTPSIFLSRLPIRNGVDIDSYIKKLLLYEQGKQNFPTELSILQMGTMISNYLPDTTQSDAKQKAEKFANSYLGLWNGSINYFFDTYNDFGHINYAFNPENINEQYENGYQFVHCLSHGNRQSHSTAMEDYTINYACQLHNFNKLPIIVTMACQTNWFDGLLDPCLSEAFIRHPTGGSVFYWGSSRYGWSSKNNNNYVNIGSSLKYNGVLFKQLLNHNRYHWAEACAYAKNVYANSSNYYGPYRWLQISINPIGDPETPIFTESPIKFHNVNIVKHNDTLTVNTGGVVGCEIAISSDYGNSFLRTFTNVDSVTVTNVPSNYTVVITKHNYIPYIYGNPLYIQNEIITDIQSYKAGDAFAGKSVTDIKPHGNVVVESGGKLIVDSDNSTVLDKGFEVKLGGTLEIK